MDNWGDGNSPGHGVTTFIKDRTHKESVTQVMHEIAKVNAEIRRTFSEKVFRANGDVFAPSLSESVLIALISALPVLYSPEKLYLTSALESLSSGLDVTKNRFDNHGGESNREGSW